MIFNIIHNNGTRSTVEANNCFDAYGKSPIGSRVVGPEEELSKRELVPMPLAGYRRMPNTSQNRDVGNIAFIFFTVKDVDVVIFHDSLSSASSSGESSSIRRLYFSTNFVNCRTWYGLLVRFDLIGSKSSVAQQDERIYGGCRWSAPT